VPVDGQALTGRRRRGPTGLLFTLLICASFESPAQELEPRAYSPSPIGTNFLLAGYARSSGDVVVDASLPFSDIDAQLNFGTLAYGHTFGVLGRSANVLVVANETVVGTPLLDKIRERAAKGPASFLIICPQSDPNRADHPEAERRLRRALAILRGEGIDAHGQVSHPDPYTAAMQAIHDERTDEIIVSTFAPERSPWLRKNLVQRLHDDSGLPVEHVIVSEAAPAAGTPDSSPPGG